MEDIPLERNKDEFNDECCAIAGGRIVNVDGLRDGRARVVR